MSVDAFVRFEEPDNDELGEYFTISIVSRMYGLHPQTLRLYEREGLPIPHRSEGNRRLYCGKTCGV
jgi:MerR family transcriptional regulator/heat shock protein HspR